MTDSSKRSLPETTSSATTIIDRQSPAVDRGSQANGGCTQCTIRQWHRTLEEQKTTILAHEKDRITAEYKTLQTSFQKLQEDYERCRAQFSQLQATLVKKEGELKAEHHSKHHMMLHWQAENDLRQSNDIRFNQALTSLSQFASAFYLAQVDAADLTREQQSALRSMDYAQVVKQRDAYKVQSLELHQRMQGLLRGEQRAYQPCGARCG